MEVATKFVQPFIPTLLSLILTSLSPIPATILYVLVEQFAHPSPLSQDFRQKLRGKTSVSLHSSLPMDPLLTSGRCASFLPTVGKLALTRTTKECNQWETRFEGISGGISSGKGRCGSPRIENREIRKRSRNLRLWQWRQLRWSSRHDSGSLYRPIFLNPTISQLTIPNFIT